MELNDIVRKHPELDPVLSIVKGTGISKLFPPQKLALEAGILDGENLLLSCGTGSGKTLIAELAALKCWLNTKRKTVYVVPLRSLAMEKFDDFKKYEPLGLKPALSIGDYDSSDEWLSGADVIVTTFEKLDSLLRHRTPWSNDIGLAILDEVHELGSDRGPTLEMVTLWLKKLGVQFLGLSATIGNSQEIAKWLGAELVVSDFRPVPLYEGTYWNGMIEFIKKGTTTVPGGELTIVEQELKNSKQALIFMNTRREAEAMAVKSRELCINYCDRQACRKLAEKVLHALERPTEQCKKLADCVAHGCSFHHAGITNKQRKLIEDAYRQGVTKFIAATVTLVAGVNLPAHRIIIRSLRAYDREWTVSTYKQAVGRAGRIRFDTEGEAVVMCRSENDRDYVVSTYLNGQPEPALSQLGNEPVLRMHVLGAIARERFNRESLKAFFFDSFYAFQYKDNPSLSRRLDRVIDQLIQWHMVHESGYLVPTKLGQRVSELYIDPATGHLFAEEIDKSGDKTGKYFGYLQLFSQAAENQPPPSLRKTEIDKIQEQLDEHSGELLSLAPLPGDVDFEEYFRAAKLTCILNDWVSERSEDQLLLDYNIPPGTLRERIRIGEWLVYACHEIADIQGLSKAKAELSVLERRIHHGVKPELLPLVIIRGIGRVRGRKMFNAGFRTKSDVLNDPEKAKKVLGERIINKIMY